MLCDRNIISSNGDALSFLGQRLLEDGSNVLDRFYGVTKLLVELCDVSGHKLVLQQRLLEDHLHFVRVKAVWHACACARYKRRVESVYVEANVNWSI